MDTFDEKKSEPLKISLLYLYHYSLTSHNSLT